MFRKEHIAIRKSSKAVLEQLGPAYISFIAREVIKELAVSIKCEQREIIEKSQSVEKKYATEMQERGIREKDLLRIRIITLK